MSPEVVCTLVAPDPQRQDVPLVDERLAFPWGKTDGLRPAKDPHPLGQLDMYCLVRGLDQGKVEVRIDSDVQARINQLFQAGHALFVRVKEEPED